MFPLANNALALIVCHGLVVYPFFQIKKVHHRPRTTIEGLFKLLIVQWCDIFLSFELHTLCRILALVTHQLLTVFS